MPSMRTHKMLFTVVVAVLASCSTDGTSMVQPGSNGATAPTIFVPETVAPMFDESVQTFLVGSQAFESAGTLPIQYTAQGTNTSPPLEWGGVPEGTVDLALVMTDPTADGFIHWLIWGLDPLAIRLDPGTVAPEAVQGTNDFGIVGYSGPNPPPGDEPHLYLFRLFALDAPSFDIDPSQDGVSIIEELEARSIGVAEVFAFYGIPES
jgi:Raf kinase inhibitor-like YbhB/YbcL family protein